MTENEAIAKMKYRIKTVTNMAGKGADGKAYEDMEMAIEALEEIQQYRAIGTVEECREAREKQRAKIPGYEGDGYSDGEMVYDTWICPNCSESWEVDFDEYEYCPNCGQHIDRLRGEEGRMKYKCTKEMFLTKCDGDGFEIQNEYGVVSVGSIWERDDDTSYLGGDVHLESADDNEFGWIEISIDDLKENFVLVDKGGNQ